MSEPQKHHFVPQFLMRPWANPVTQKLTYIWKPHDKLVLGSASPKSLGCDEKLYTLSHDIFPDRQMIETGIMTKDIDTPAATVHGKLLSGLEPESLQLVDKFHFAALCILLALRRPEVLKPIQENAEETMRQALRKMDRTVSGVTGPMSEAEADSLYKKDFAGIGRGLALVELANQKRKSKYILQLMGLDWKTFTVPAGGLQFVLGDNPVQQYGKKGDGVIQRLYLPISPNMLFVAGSKGFFASDIDLRDEFRDILPLKHMMDQFALATKFAILGPDVDADRYLKAGGPHFSSGKPSMRLEI